MRRLALGLVIAAIVGGGVYLLLVSGQGNRLGWATALVTALIVVPALASAIGAMIAPRLLRGLLLGFGFVGLLGMSFLAAMSIGVFLLPLVVAALVLLVWRLAVLGRWEEWVLAVFGAALGVLAVFGYVHSLPYLPPACPTGVTASGASDYPAGSIYSDQEVRVSWTCENGRLVSWSHYP